MPFTIARWDRPPVPPGVLPEQSRGFRLLHPFTARAERQAAEREHWAKADRANGERWRAQVSQTTKDHYARAHEREARQQARHEASEAARKANRVPVVKVGTARREGGRVFLEGFRFGGPGGEQKLPPGPLPAWLGWTGGELAEMADAEATYQKPSAPGREPGPADREAEAG